VRKEAANRVTMLLLVSETVRCSGVVEAIVIIHPVPSLASSTPSLPSPQLLVVVQCGTELATHHQRDRHPHRARSAVDFGDGVPQRVEVGAAPPLRRVQRRLRLASLQRCKSCEIVRLGFGTW
jgi:hypothetical protein